MITKAEYVVEGMSCQGCERTVQKVTTNIPGVISAKANAESSTLIVELDPEKVTPAMIEKAVSSVGYKFTGAKQ